MTVATDYTRLFTEGFAQLLADAGLGLTWQSSGVYAPTDTGIYIGTLPPDVAGSSNPGWAVTLFPYPLGDDPALSDTTTGLQIRTRGPGEDVRDVWSLDDRIADYLLGLFSFTLPTGVLVASLTRSSSGSLGQDDARRWQWASSYTALTYRPSQHRN